MEWCREWCREIRPRVSFWRQKAHLFQDMRRSRFLSEVSWEIVTFCIFYFIFYVIVFCLFFYFFLILTHVVLSHPFDNYSWDYVLAKIKGVYRAIDQIIKVIANGPGDQSSIPGRVIPKTQKMLLDATLLNTQHYKEWIKGKVEQSRERNSALPYTSV